MEVRYNGIFKALVGEDFLTAERKNEDLFSFHPYARLLFSCNSILRNYGDKFLFWDESNCRLFARGVMIEKQWHRIGLWDITIK